MSRPSGARNRTQPSAARALDLAAAVLSAGDEPQVLKRLAPLAALPEGLGLGRAFLLLADSERAGCRRMIAASGGGRTGHAGSSLVW